MTDSKDDWARGVIARAVAGGMPEQDGVLIAALPEERRLLVLSRLNALLDSDASSDPADERDRRLAAAFGLSATRTAAIRRKWARGGRLTALGARPSTKDTRRSRFADTGVRDRMIEFMAVRLTEDPDARAAAVIAEAVARNPGVAVGRTALYRWFAEAGTRVVAPLGFGAQLEFERLELPTLMTSSAPHRLVICVDRASRIVVGAALETTHDTVVVSQIKAASHAVDRLPALRLGSMPVAAAVSTLGFLDPGSDAIRGARVIRSLAGHVEIELRTGGSRPRSAIGDGWLGDIPVSPVGEEPSGGGRGHRMPDSAGPGASPVRDARLRTVLDRVPSVVREEDAWRRTEAAVGIHNGTILSRFRETIEPMAAMAIKAEAAKLLRLVKD